MELRAYIYKGNGVGAFSFKESYKMLVSLLPKNSKIQSISKEEIESGKLYGAFLFLMPGGLDVPYDRELKGSACDQIQSFVKSGGIYFGICAGAYFGSKRVVFQAGSEMEVIEERSLRFFPGDAVGCLYKEKKFSYQDDSGASACQILHKGKVLYAYYNGGCFFKNASSFPNIEIIGHYLDSSPSMLPAIISTKIGKGRSILSGVHIEYEPKRLPSTFTGKEKLISSNAPREKLLQKLIFDSM